jgi:hypothetical protein
MELSIIEEMEGIQQSGAIIPQVMISIPNVIILKLTSSYRIMSTHFNRIN